MDAELRYEPTTVRRGIAYLDDAGQELADTHREFSGDICELGGSRPWGQDALGSAFQANYDAIVPTVMAAWDRLAAFVDGYARAVASAADAAEQADAAAQRRLTW